MSLASPKICSKNFENWLTTKNVLPQNDFYRDFLYKNNMEGK